MDLRNKKILLIDDDDMILKSLRAVFTPDGFDVITANNGNTGLVEALNQEPDLIITDIEMKDVDGIVILDEIRKSGPWGEKVPIILLTNFDTNERVLKGIVDNHPSLYLLKSKVNPKQILVKVKELLHFNDTKNEQQTFK
ncbi:MAG: response regulator [Candidatus Paceibacterota bacterium]